MRQSEHQDGWLMKLRARRNPNVAAVALANKNARVVWALLGHQREYCAGQVAAAA
jgi:transposase